MQSFVRISALVICLVVAAQGFAGEGSTNAPATKDTKQPPVAKSHDELGNLVASAIDKEDYETLVQLMVPPGLLKELEAPEEKQKEYADYLSKTPDLAKRYRAYLKGKELLPLTGKKLQKFDEERQPKRQINGKTVRRSTGVRLLDKDGKIVFELVDMAIAVDGRWYVTRLCTEDLEQELKKNELQAQ
jgi:hypothetical protein